MFRDMQYEPGTKEKKKAVIRDINADLEKDIRGRGGGPSAAAQ